MTRTLLDDNTYVVAVSIKDKSRREHLFKHIDSKANAKHVVDKSSSTRVIDEELFGRLQAKIEADRHCRLSLLSLTDTKGEYEPFVTDAKPLSDEYAEILRRIRF